MKKPTISYYGMEENNLTYPDHFEIQDWGVVVICGFCEAITDYYYGSPYCLSCESKFSVDKYEWAYYLLLSHTYKRVY
jgi:hypothetical protein